MSCQGRCQAHQSVSDQDFDFSYFGNSPYGIWPCNSEERYLQTPGNRFSDSFDTTTYPTSTWVGSEINGFPTFSTVAPKDLVLHQPQSIEDPSVATEPPSRDTETRRVVASLESKVENLERLFENLQNK
jgi:hypothetical protein